MNKKSDFEFLNPLDRATIAKHREQCLGLAYALQDAGASLKVPRRDWTYATESASVAIADLCETGKLKEDSFLQLDGSNVEWDLNARAPKVEPNDHSAAWTNTHCVVLCRSEEKSLKEVAEAITHDLIQIEEAWPELLRPLQHLVQVAIVVHQNQQRFEGVPWVSIGNTEFRRITELLAEAAGYWCRAFVSSADPPGDRMEQLIFLSFSPFLVADNKLMPEGPENVLSPQHPVFCHLP